MGKLIQEKAHCANPFVFDNTQLFEDAAKPAAKETAGGIDFEPKKRKCRGPEESEVDHRLRLVGRTTPFNISEWTDGSATQPSRDRETQPNSAARIATGGASVMSEYNLTECGELEETLSSKVITGVDEAMRNSAASWEHLLAGCMRKS